MTVSVANKLVELRRKSGLSQEELAERLGISRQAVSKWERAEASPDTDNLVTLAKLYNISLDELLLDADPAAGAPDEQPQLEEPEQGEEKPHGKHVDISGGEVHISDDGDEVHIGRDGIYVSDKNGEHVNIGHDGVFVNGRKYTKKAFRRTALDNFPFALVIIIAYIIIGAVFGIWHPTWIMLLLVPVFGSVVKCVRRRSARYFAYPVFAVCAFLTMGFLWWLWHPGWVIFPTVPLYYSLFPKKHECHWDDEDADIDFDDDDDDL